MMLRRPWRKNRSLIFGFVLVLLGSVFAPNASLASEADDDAAAGAVETALLRRLTVWRKPSGARVFVRSCREAKPGCEARIAAMSKLFAASGKRFDVDPFLLAAVAMRESGLNPFATGGIGERGIVQLHPRGVGHGVKFVKSEWFRKKCERQADACQSEVIDAGARLLASAIRRCGDVRSALGAYNSGHCNETHYGKLVMSERLRMLRLLKRGEAPRIVAK